MRSKPLRSNVINIKKKKVVFRNFFRHSGFNCALNWVLCSLVHSKFLLGGVNKSLHAAKRTLNPFQFGLIVRLEHWIWQYIFKFTLYSRNTQNHSKTGLHRFRPNEPAAWPLAPRNETIPCSEPTQNGQWLPPYSNLWRFAKTRLMHCLGWTFDDTVISRKVMEQVMVVIDSHTSAAAAPFQRSAQLLRTQLHGGCRGARWSLLTCWRQVAEVQRIGMGKTRGSQWLWTRQTGVAGVRRAAAAVSASTVTNCVIYMWCTCTIFSCSHLRRPDLKQTDERCYGNRQICQNLGPSL